MIDYQFSPLTRSDKGKLSKHRGEGSLFEKLSDQDAAAYGKDCERGHEKRYCNPFIGKKARAFQWGWNKSHGACIGCKLCEVGTPDMTCGLQRWINRGDI